MKKLIIVLLFTVFQYSNGQTVELQSMSDLTQQKLFSAGNVFIKDKTKKNLPTNLKGDPYLNKKFLYGNIVFDNSKKYSALIRLDVSEQKFEIKNDVNSPISSIGIDKTVKVNIGEKNYKLHSFTINSESESTLAILEEILVTENFSLYLYPKKLIKFPDEKGISAPASGYQQQAAAQWKDDNKFIILKNNIGYLVPKSHKKMSELNLIDSSEYKKYRKKNKLNLKDQESLKKFIVFLNS